MRKCIMIATILAMFLCNLILQNSYILLFSGSEYQGGVEYDTILGEIYFGLEANMGEIVEISKIPYDKTDINFNLNENRVIMSKNGNEKIICSENEYENPSTCKITNKEIKKDTYIMNFNYQEASVFAKLHKNPIITPKNKLAFQLAIDTPWKAKKHPVLGLNPKSIFAQYLINNDQTDFSFMMTGFIVEGFTRTSPTITMNPAVHRSWIAQSIESSSSESNWLFQGKLSIEELNYQSSGTFCFESKYSEVLILPESLKFCEFAIRKVCNGFKTCKIKKADLSLGPIIEIVSNNYKLRVSAEQYITFDYIEDVKCNIRENIPFSNCPPNSMILPKGFFDLQRVQFTYRQNNSVSISFLTYFYIPNYFYLYPLGVLALIALITFAKLDFKSTNFDEKLNANKRKFLFLMICMDFMLFWSQFYLGGNLENLVYLFFYTNGFGTLLFLSTLRIFCNKSFPEWMKSSLQLVSFLLPCFCLRYETWTVETTYYSGGTQVGRSESQESNSSTMIICFLIGLCIAFWSIMCGFAFCALFRTAILFQDVRMTVNSLKIGDFKAEEQNFTRFVRNFSVFCILFSFLPNFVNLLKIIGSHPEVFELEFIHVAINIFMTGFYAIFHLSIISRYQFGSKKKSGFDDILIK